jgi:hypothetical protein
MASQEYPAPTSDRGAQPSRDRLRALLWSTNGRLVLVAYVSLMISVGLSFGMNWRHPQPIMLAAYKATSVLWMLMLLILGLRFLWHLPIWAHLLETLGWITLFLSEVYSPLFVRVDAPLDDAMSHLASTLSAIAISLMLVGYLPLLAGAALHGDRFRRPG